VRVYNFGVAGWTTFQIKNYLEYYSGRLIDRLNPALFLFYIGGNDIQSVTNMFTYRQMWEKKMETNAVIRSTDEALRNLRLYSGFKLFVKDLLLFKSESADTAGDDVRAVPLSDSADNIKEILAMVQKKNCKVVFVGEVFSSPVASEELAKFHKLIKMRAGGDIHYIDAESFLKSKNMQKLFYDNVHLTDEGNRVLGGYLAEKLTEMGLVPENKIK